VSNTHTSDAQTDKESIGRIEAIVGPSIEALGYDLVRVMMTGGRRPTLQIMAERADGSGMNVDDCAKISRTISAVLDVEDPIAGEYTLEVSSPGIDRPLTRLKDFRRFAGFEARVDMAELIDGRKRFSGRLVGVDDADRVLVETEPGARQALPFEGIARAKLILTDELVAASAPDRGAGGE
jgi:ribosome maturation factor RimP